MSGNNDPRVTGLTLPWVLTIVFMVLKLCKVITWKWIWVFAPVWLSLALALLAVLVYIILYIRSKNK